MKKNNWSLFIINGLIALLFGLLLLIEAPDVIVRLTLYFGILMMIAGVIMFLVSLGSMRKKKPYLALMAGAVVSVLAGGVIVFLPHETLKIFLMLIGAWAVLAGLYQIIVAVRMRGRVSNHHLFTINGVITLAFGILLFLNPMGSVILVMRIIGLMALLSGILMLYLGVKIRTSPKVE